jgi:glycosyltransferase involved in cell wall biosynthesis
VRIAYLLPWPELGGGTKVVFQHAELLARHGHRVTVFGEGPQPAWLESAVEYADWTRDTPPTPPDLVIATYYSTIAVARRLALGPVAHFCQGFEGWLPHLAPEHAAIEEAYSLPLPALTVAPHLAGLLATRFGRESRLAPPPVDPLFSPALRRRPRSRPWIVVPGIFEAPVKGVATALAAVALLRAGGLACRVLRISALPLSREEADLLVPDQFLCAAPPAQVARALRRCDLLLFPSAEEEGFGLPLLEAMAAKVPAVASDIPATRFTTGGSVTLVAPGAAAAMAAAAGELLAAPRRWRAARRVAWAASRRFAADEVAPQLCAAVEWAAERAVPPQELGGPR